MFRLALHRILFSDRWCVVADAEVTPVLPFPGYFLIGVIPPERMNTEFYPDRDP